MRTPGGLRGLSEELARLQVPTTSPDVQWVPARVSVASRPQLTSPARAQAEDPGAW